MATYYLSTKNAGEVMEILASNTGKKKIFRGKTGNNSFYLSINKYPRTLLKPVFRGTLKENPQGTIILLRNAPEPERLFAGVVLICIFTGLTFTFAMSSLERLLFIVAFVLISTLVSIMHYFDQCRQLDRFIKRNL